MTTKDKVARHKLSPLQSASELEDIGRACNVMGYSHQQFSEIRRNFHTWGRGPTLQHADLFVTECELALGGGLLQAQQALVLGQEAVATPTHHPAAR